MDIASVVGLILGIVLIVGSIFVGGGSFGAFIDVPSILVVFGGSFAAALMCFPLRSLMVAPKAFKVVFFNKSPSVAALIPQLVSLAETARRDGLLALEARLAEIDNPFIILGVQMAVDGARPETIEDVLRTEMESLANRHRDAKSVFDQIGRFAPAYGMIGTLMGLIIMLGNMSDPSKIGAGMAVALITTLYGAIASNMVFLPFAEKLALLNKRELLAMDVILRGIMGIQAGENPRVIEQKLSTFLAPKERKKGDA
jgi:chemotaxis protein MotA